MSGKLAAGAYPGNKVPELKRSAKAWRYGLVLLCGETQVTKDDLVVDIAQKTGLQQLEVKRIVQMVLDGITEALATEGRLELRSFGVFQVRERKERTARNPKTGITVEVPSRKAVVFKAGKLMKERIRHGPLLIGTPEKTAAAATDFPGQEEKARSEGAI